MNRVGRSAVVERRLLEISGSADIARERGAAAERDVGTGDHDPYGLNVPAGGNDIKHVTGHDSACRDVLHVDDWRFGGDGDRLFDGADFHFPVDRRGEVRRQLDAVALDGVEAWQCEGDGVGAGPKRLDLVLTRPVRHAASRFFDERRAGDFNRDAGQDGPRRISDRSRNRAGLSQRGSWQRCERQGHNSGPYETAHSSLPSSARMCRSNVRAPPRSSSYARKLLPLFTENKNCVAGPPARFQFFVSTVDVLRKPTYRPDGRSGILHPPPPH